jgi:hypothetical protein
MCAKIQYICISLPICDYGHRPKTRVVASAAGQLHHLERKTAYPHPAQEGHHQNNGEAKNLAKTPCVDRSSG